MTARRRGDAGSAVVDFVLVTGLVLALVLVVLQLALVLHERAVLVAAAAEGARYAANADRTPAEGALRARQAAAAGLPPALVAALEVGVAPPTFGVVEVSISAPVPRVLPLPPVRLSVRGHCLQEGAG